MESTTPELDVPIGLAIDFADELAMDLNGALVSPSPSQTTGRLTSIESASPASTTYMTSPSISPIARPTSFAPTMSPDSDSDSSELDEPKGKLVSDKGKSRAIPTPRLTINNLAREFHTPPDTSFGTPSGSGMAKNSARAVTEPTSPDLPSIMPLGPSPAGPQADDTPRPSRIRSGISFGSLREAVNNHRKSISRQSSLAPTTSGPGSPVQGIARRLSLKGLGALVRRKKDKESSRSRSGLSSQVTSGASTPASAFLTPSSTIVRRANGTARESISGIWESGPSATTPRETSPKVESEVATRPIRGRADTAPGDYFGFTFGFEDEEERDGEDTDEPSREDSSDVLIETSPAEPPRPTSIFDTLPRELHLLILSHLARSYVGDYERALRDGDWSVSRAESDQHKWVGEAAGLRAIIGTARVSKSWHTLAHDGSFWSRIHYASLVPTRPAVPAHTNWITPGVRAQAKAQPQSAELDAQDERVLRLLRTAGPCLTELDLRGFARIDTESLQSLVDCISAPIPVVPKSEVPVQSLLSLTRCDAVPTLPPRATNLTRLVLSSCLHVSSGALHALLSVSPHLQHLEMRALPAVTDETCSIISTVCRSIAYLDVSRCQNLGPEAVYHICGVARLHIPNTGLTRLKALHMAGYAYIDSIVLRRLGSNLGHTLETLNLSGAWGVHDSSIAAYVEIQPSPAQLERARLADVERWSRAKNMRRDWESEDRDPKFVKLSAREAGFDPTLAGPFYRRLVALRHLNLSNCRRLSDAGIGALAHAAPNLEILELAGISGIGQPGMVRLLQTCKRIRRLDLEETAVGDAVLEAITPPINPDPQEAEQDDNAEEESIHVAVRADPSYPGHALTHLLLSHCTSPQLTSPALALLVRACPKLEVLVVDGTQVDDRVLRFFVGASRARGVLGAEIGATDARHVARYGLPPAEATRPRRGTREWAARGMGYVDGQDMDVTAGQDECDESKVVVKTYWSWQAVDAVLERRRMSAGLSRRNTDGAGVSGGSGIRGNGPRWRGRHEERPGCIVM